MPALSCRRAPQPRAPRSLAAALPHPPLRLRRPQLCRPRTLLLGLKFPKQKPSQLSMRTLSLLPMQQPPNNRRATLGKALCHTRRRKRSLTLNQLTIRAPARLLKKPQNALLPSLILAQPRRPLPTIRLRTQAPRPGGAFSGASRSLAAQLSLQQRFFLPPPTGPAGRQPCGSASSRSLRSRQASLFCCPHA